MVVLAGSIKEDAQIRVQVINISFSFYNSTQGTNTDLLASTPVCEDWCRPNPTRTACDCSQPMEGTPAVRSGGDFWCATGWVNAEEKDGA